MTIKKMTVEKLYERVVKYAKHEVGSIGTPLLRHFSVRYAEKKWA